MVFLLLFYWLFFPKETTAPTPSYNPCITYNSSWQGGEEITYKLYYQLNFIWIAAGEATFKVHEQGDKYKITIKGKTISAFEWFYKVNDTYESVIDKHTLLPISFSRDIKEGKYEWWDKFNFDQTNKKVYATKGGPNQPIKSYTVQLTDCMHDMISIVYHIRNLDLEAMQVGQKMGVNVFVEEVYPLEVELKAKNQETKIRNMGDFNTHVIRPEVISGHFFNEDTKMDVYVSADANRIPLMIESPVSVGKVKAVLSKHKGLRHPLHSKK